MFNFSLSTILIRLIVLLVGIPIHEWAHAWSAFQLGDDTARLQGRLTLNPFAHLDPFGSILMLFSGFGWGKPVPISSYRMRVNPRTGMAISSAAGPFSNFVMAMLFAIPFRLGWLDLSATFLGGGFNLASLLVIAIQINLGLMLFNLIPVYPLDGEKILVGILPAQWGDSLLRLRPHGTLILAGLLFVLPQLGLDLVGLFINPMHSLLWKLLLLV
jgi:Zn-dependent protease